MVDFCYFSIHEFFTLKMYLYYHTYVCEYRCAWDTAYVPWSEDNLGSWLLPFPLPGTMFTIANVGQQLGLPSISREEHWHRRCRL